MAKLTPSYFEYNTAPCRPGRTHPRVKHRIANQAVETASCRIHIISAVSPFAWRSSSCATNMSRTNDNSDYFQAQPSNDSREPIISQDNSITTTIVSLSSSLRQTTPTTAIYHSRTNALHSSHFPEQKQTKSKKQKASSASPHHPVATCIRKQPKSAAHRPTTPQIPDQGASATSTPIRPGKERQSAVFKMKAPTRESPLLPALAASSNYTRQRHLHRPCPPTTRILSPLFVFFFSFPPFASPNPPPSPLMMPSSQLPNIP